MEKNLEDIRSDFEVSHFSTIPDGTPHYHNYIEIELIENGNGTQIINDQSFNISKRTISVLRPYIDKQSIMPLDTHIQKHNITFKAKQIFNVKSGVMHIVSGDNAGKLYFFLFVDDNIVSEVILDEKFSCDSLGFFAKFTTKDICISESDNVSLDFSKSKILSKNDEFSYYDIASNSSLGLPSSFILDKNDLSFYKYNRSERNRTGSFVYCCNISASLLGYRIISFKLIDKNKEINFLLSTDKIYFFQVSPKHEFKMYKLCINPNIVDNETQKKLLSFYNPLCIDLSNETYENIKRIFELLLYFYSQNNTPDKTIIDLVSILLRLFLNESFYSTNANQLRETVLMYFMENNNFLNNVTLKDFSEYLGYESGYASRLCIKYTGCSFVKYKIHLRLQYAKYLISSTSTPIAEISINSGFNSLSVFNRFFKKETGLSPSAYRLLHQQRNN